MKKIICKKEYDTETATLIQKYSVGSFGDPAGYEECLFCTPDGFYFLFVQGGKQSPYPETNLIRMGKAKAEAWLEMH